MQFVIISGLSGAGKSKVAANLEDLGYYCVDNMPAEMIPQFAQICLARRGRYEKSALVTDVRGGMTFDTLFQSLDALDAMKMEYSILFVEASSDVLIQRFKETRRIHPLMQDGTSLTDAVERERQLLEPIRNRANAIVDTSRMTLGKLRGAVLDLIGGGIHDQAMHVRVQSFGFKYGLPMDADIVYDVRFLPNPYYIPELRQKTGLDADVKNFVFQYQQTRDFLNKIEDLLMFTLPQYIDEGKTELVIAIGCTGGRHRSVCVAKELADYISYRGYSASVGHRDMGRKG
ncbi:MAG: RNase adapter RapZ [Oscillospiraceae bacterium]|nr:RNase adapter RapZ [Oscillospiraceae bacterium]